MRGARAFPDRRESQLSAKARLVQILYGCTEGALAGFTAERLAAMYNVPVKECEYALIIARQKRGVTPRG